MKDSDKPNNEALALKQLKSIKVALWTLVTVFVIIPVVAGIGTGLVMGFKALNADDAYSDDEEWPTKSEDWGLTENVETPSKSVEIANSAKVIADVFPL